MFHRQLERLSPMAKLFTTVAFFSGLTALVVAPAAAQGGVYVEFPPQVKVTGGVEALTGYVLRDAYAATPEPVVQGNLSISYDTGDYGEFSANAWGSKGIATNIGDELDLGVAWRKELGGELSVKVVYNRFILKDAPDMDEYTVTFAKGDFDASYTYYMWHEGFEDGQRVNVGYNHQFDDKWSGRVDLTGETGLGLSNSFVVGFDLNYMLNDNFSVGGTLLIPFTEEDDGRDIQFVVGTGFSF